MSNPFRKIEKRKEKQLVNNFKSNIKDMNDVARFVENALYEKRKEDKEKQHQNEMFYCNMIVILVAYTLACEGFGKKRLPKLMKRIMENIDSYRTGHLTMDDIPEIRNEVRARGFDINF